MVALERPLLQVGRKVRGGHKVTSQGKKMYSFSFRFYRIARLVVPILSQTCSNPKLDNRDPESGYPYFTRIFLSDSLQGPALAGIAKEVRISVKSIVVFDMYQLFCASLCSSIAARSTDGQVL